MNHRSGTNGTPLDRRHENWAQIVRGAGYDPVLFGYTDTSPDPRDYPADHPVLTTYEGVLPGLRVETLLTRPTSASWVQWLRARGVAIPARPYDLYFQKADQIEFENGGPGPAPLRLPSNLHDTFFMTDQVIDYVTDRREPWCVHLSLLRPHPPWIAPAPYHARYRARRVAGIRARGVGGGRRRAASVARVSAVGQELSRAGVGEEAAPPESVVLRSDERGGRQPRPPVRASEGDRPVRRHADRVHVRPRRADRRSLAARQVRLLRPVVSHPVDRARSARVGRCDARPNGRCVHRERRHHADDARMARHRRAARVRRPLADPLPEIVDRPARAGATKRTGNSISAIRPTTARSARSAFRCTRARST